MTDKPIAVSSYGNGSFTASNLTNNEIDRLRGSLAGGHHWVRRGCNGRLEHVPVHEKLPGPLEDEAMLPLSQLPSN